MDSRSSTANTSSDGDSPRPGAGSASPFDTDSNSDRDSSASPRSESKGNASITDMSPEDDFVIDLPPEIQKGGLFDTLRQHEFFAHQFKKKHGEIVNDDGIAGNYQVIRIDPISGLVCNIFIPEQVEEKDNKAQIYVAFQGTKDRAGALRDLDKNPGESSFQSVAATVMNEILSAVQSVKHSNLSLTIVGHSLGGADAQRCFVECMDKINNNQMGEIKKLTLTALNSAGVSSQTAERSTALAKQLCEKKLDLQLNVNWYHVHGDPVQQSGEGSVLSNIDNTVARVNLIKCSPKNRSYNPATRALNAHTSRGFISTDRTDEFNVYSNNRADERETIKIELNTKSSFFSFATRVSSVMIYPFSPSPNPDSEERIKKLALDEQKIRAQEIAVNTKVRANNIAKLLQLKSAFRVNALKAKEDKEKSIAERSKQNSIVIEAKDLPPNHNADESKTEKAIETIPAFLQSTHITTNQNNVILDISPATKEESFDNLDSSKASKNNKPANQINEPEPILITPLSPTDLSETDKICSDKPKVTTKVFDNTPKQTTIVLLTDEKQVAFNKSITDFLNKMKNDLPLIKITKHFQQQFNTQMEPTSKKALLTQFEKNVYLYINKQSARTGILLGVLIGAIVGAALAVIASLLFSAPIGCAIGAAAGTALVSGTIGFFIDRKQGQNQVDPLFKQARKT
jgi:hypothetical protein